MNNTAASSPDRSSVEPDRRAAAIAEVLRATYPETYDLRFSTPFELLIAAVLAVQCTDQRVNEVTPTLFAEYPTPIALALADPVSLAALLSSLSLFNRKTRQLIAVADRLIRAFGGTVPEDADDLRSLEGVGEKTVALVRGLAFGLEALPVDRHVLRVAQRTGLAEDVPAEVVSAKLREMLPSEQWMAFALTAVHHGRLVCTARAPQCRSCRISAHCAAALDAETPSHG
jgi:endonuclease-3